MYIPGRQNNGVYTGQTEVTLPGCDASTIFLPPPSGCYDCDTLEQRVTVLETLLADMTSLEIAKTDVNGDVVTLTIVGKVGGS